MFARRRQIFVGTRRPKAQASSFVMSQAEYQAECHLHRGAGGTGSGG